MSAAFRLRGDLEELEAETALLWDAGCTGVAQEGGEVVAYFPAPIDLPLPGRWEEVEETDWLARYYDELEPVVLDRLIVAPTHREVTPAPHQRVLWLDPGMAFGTGHHETTRLALRALQSLDLAGKRVLDVGAGSGILAIAADLLGAAEALGLDNDPLTLPVAEENGARNDSKASFKLGTLDETVLPASADILVANLYAELHADLAPAYMRVLSPNGYLLVTGILEDRLPLVEAALTLHFDLLATKLEGPWALLHAVKRRV